MKYRKKPVMIDAFQWTADEHQGEDPDWIIKAIMDGDAWFENAGSSDVKFMIRTLEGVHEAKVGDYIIRGIAGEIYPCKPDIFRATYEAVATVGGEPIKDLKEILFDHCSVATDKAISTPSDRQNRHDGVSRQAEAAYTALLGVITAAALEAEWRNYNARKNT